MRNLRSRAGGRNAVAGLGSAWLDWAYFGWSKLGRADHVAAGHGWVRYDGSGQVESRLGRVCRRKARLSRSTA